MRAIEAQVRRAATADLGSESGQAILKETKEYLTNYADEVMSQTPCQNRSHASREHRPPARPSQSAVQMLLSLPRFAMWQLLYLLIINLFGLFVRLRFIFRSILYRVQSLLKYHHYTPALIKDDVTSFKKLPSHLSVILPSPPSPKRRSPTRSGSRHRADTSTVALEQLLNDVGELTAWSASVGVRTLSVYEKTGILKSSISGTYDAITNRLEKYFPPNAVPHLTVRVPNVPSYSRSGSTSNSPPPAEFQTEHPLGPVSDAPSRNITVLLISAEDGRDTIVDLTRTLTGMVQKGKLVPQDISTELVDFEMRESIMDEPDLLVCFTEEYHLNGYPPWHLRLTEIFHLPDHTSGVTYNVFYQALESFNRSAMRFGK